MINGNWDGFRELVLIDKVQECSDIVSFYFKVKDGGKLAVHKAGQFLPFKIKTEDPKYKEVMRTYSLSNYPNDSVYRISVKKVEGGLMSTFLHEKLNVGDSIEAMVPTGIFTIKESSKSRPIVLISGGIGVTPLLSMLYEESKGNKNIHFIQAVQNSKIHPFKDEIESTSKIMGTKNTVFYSKPLEEDTLGVNYDFEGRVTKEWIKENLSLESDFYFCGPPPFMKGLESSLLELGVDKDRINYEFFG